MSYRMFKVKAWDKKKLVAEYIYADLQPAMIFEMGMRKKGYKTELERVKD